MWKSKGMAMIDLNPAQAATRIIALLGALESRTLDFKRISAKHSRMIETVCAFANSEGIEIESPGAVPGNITVANIGRA